MHYACCILCMLYADLLPHSGSGFLIASLSSQTTARKQNRNSIINRQSCSLPLACCFSFLVASYVLLTASQCSQYYQQNSRAQYSIHRVVLVLHTKITYYHSTCILLVQEYYYKSDYKYCKCNYTRNYQELGLVQPLLLLVLQQLLLRSYISSQLTIIPLQ